MLRKDGGDMEMVEILSFNVCNMAGLLISAMCFAEINARFN